MPKNRLWISVTSFKSKAKANSRVKEWRARGYKASVKKGTIEDTGKPFYQVSVRK